MNGNIVLDGGVLLRLAYDEAPDLRRSLLAGRVRPHATELGMTEVTYHACRRTGWEDALRIRALLLDSAMVAVAPTGDLVPGAARFKCERALALPDCFTLALAQRLGCPALFASRERELLREMRRKPLPVEIRFLDKD